MSHYYNLEKAELEQGAETSEAKYYVEVFSTEAKPTPEIQKLCESLGFESSGAGYNYFNGRTESDIMPESEAKLFKQNLEKLGVKSYEPS